MPPGGTSGCFPPIRLPGWRGRRRHDGGKIACQISAARVVAWVMVGVDCRFRIVRSAPSRGDVPIDVHARTRGQPAVASHHNWLGCRAWPRGARPRRLRPWCSMESRPPPVFGGRPTAGVQAHVEQAGAVKVFRWAMHRLAGFGRTISHAGSGGWRGRRRHLSVGPAPHKCRDSRAIAGSSFTQAISSTCSERWVCIRQVGCSRQSWPMAASCSGVAVGENRGVMT